VNPAKGRRAFTVALIGPDGAGKSASSERLGEVLPLPVKRIYMGVNLEASATTLPTTRLVFAVKRARRRRPAADRSTRRRDQGDLAGQPAGLVRRAASALKSAARLVAWVSEEWFRQCVAWYHTRRGSIVVFDRHFFADYYHSDVGGSSDDRSLSSRIHGFLLDRVYPKPDLTICLDAPSDVLRARKQEAPVEWLERRRQQYLTMGQVLPHFVVVDAAQPLDDVTRDVARAIWSFHQGGSRASNRDARMPLES
jgi:thymidylate kinase